MYKAVFLDLDGTLLRDDHSISPETKNVLLALCEKGIMVVLVSARPIHGILPISDWLELQSNPLVSVNGAYILENREVTFESVIGLETVKGVHEASLASEVTLIYYNGLKWYAETSNAAIIKEQRITRVPVTIAPFSSLTDQWQSAGSYPNKVMAIGSEMAVNQLEGNLLSIYSNELNIYTSKPTYLEIMRKDASKKNAVRYLAEKHNIRQEEVLAIGDNFNDKEMIMYAGMGIAMGNAPEPIKAVADYITDTNIHDGVRKAIEQFFTV